MIYITTVHSEWYRIFLFAAKFGNLTKAGQQLHMTQPSVSYAIKQLEEALGIVLFDRLSKGVRLTPEGAQLYEHVQLAFAQLEQAERQVQELQQFKTGQIRIGANGAITKNILLPKLDQFHAQYPQIRIKLVQDKTSLIVKQMKQGQIDIGFIHLPLRDDELDISPIAPLENCFVVGPKYKALASQVVHARELLEIPLLMLSAGSSTRLFVEHWFLAQGFTAHADIELNSLEMLSAFAQRGYGAAFIPRSFIEEELASGSLLELTTAVPLPDRELGIATRKNSSVSLATARFLALFQS